MNKKIILVEDDIVEQSIIIDQFLKVDKDIEFITFDDGEEFLNYIQKDTDKFNIIILDINIPKISGKEILKTLSDEKIKSRIFLILSNSTNEKDIEQCYQYGIKSFFVKPSDIHSYTKLSKDIVNYWLNSSMKIPK